MSSVPQVHLPATPSFRLDDKRALVTGAGRGIGLAAAAALAEAGAQVTLAARTPRRSRRRQGNCGTVATKRTRWRST